MATFTTVARLHGEGNRIILEVRDNAGNLAPQFHRVLIDLDDIETLAAVDGITDVEIKVRKLKWKDYEADCVEKYAYFLMSAPQAVPL